MRRWWQRNRLWLVGFGLMLASSGLDGVYMSKWMPGGWGWLGFVMNTVADFADLVIGHEYGKLQRQRSSDQKRVLSVFLLGGEVVAIAYSWLFSWRQLRIVLPLMEPTDWPWVAAVSAGFVPLLLFFVGFAQALGETNADLLDREEEPRKPVQVVVRRRPTREEWREIYPNLNGDRANLDGDRVNAILWDRGFERIPASTARDWAKEVTLSAD